MTQKFTVLFDLDGTLVDTAPDLMLAHNHVMKKFGYPTKSLDELKNTVGQGAGAMIGRSIWSQAKKELTSINEKIKNEMTDEFISYYGKNILNESTLMPGVKDFLNWCKKENISMAVCTNKTEHLAVDLLKKIGIYDYFEYVAGYNTFDYCKPVYNNQKYYNPQHTRSNHISQFFLKDLLQDVPFYSYIQPLIYFLFYTNLKNLLHQASEYFHLKYFFHNKK